MPTTINRPFFLSQSILTHCENCFNLFSFFVHSTDQVFTMADNKIYFNAGFKSFDITRWSSGNTTWFDWVERSRKRMRRITLSRKIMEWICCILKDASNDNKNLVRRWRTKEQISEFYGTRKYNVHGRYMSFLALIGETKEVIIVPELGINAGWRNIAFKIEGFINTTPQCLVKQHSKPTIPYARVVERSKWQQQSHKESNASIEGPLGRSITGLFGGSERPTLTVVRKWASSTWKKAFGVNIYEMAEHIFLFEFPNKHMAEQILQGEWNWKNMKMKLEWWNPLVGCVPSQQRQEKIWIKAIGVPLHGPKKSLKRNR